MSLIFPIERYNFTTHESKHNCLMRIRSITERKMLWDSGRPFIGKFKSDKVCIWRKEYLFCGFIPMKGTGNFHLIKLKLNAQRETEVSLLSFASPWRIMLYILFELFGIFSCITALLTAKWFVLLISIAWMVAIWGMLIAIFHNLRINDSTLIKKRLKAIIKNP